jgi:thiamine pyrophosphokinase
MRECIIFGSAEIKDYSSVKVDEDAYIIAADGGLCHTNVLGLRPDILIGDFDSLNAELPSDCKIITSPAEKDDTDMMLAVKTALQNGYRSITIYGGTGGRLDHTFANIQTLEYVLSHGAEGKIIGDKDIIYIQSAGQKEYKCIPNSYFSIFSLTESVTVTTTGTKYNLTDYNLTRSFPLGVSNIIINEYCKVEVKTGILLIIFSKE